LAYDCADGIAVAPDVAFSSDLWAFKRIAGTTDMIRKLGASVLLAHTSGFQNVVDHKWLTQVCEPKSSSSQITVAELEGVFIILGCVVLFTILCSLCKAILQYCGYWEVLRCKRVFDEEDQDKTVDDNGDDSVIRNMADVQVTRSPLVELEDFGSSSKGSNPEAQELARFCRGLLQELKEAKAMKVPPLKGIPARDDNVKRSPSPRATHRESMDALAMDLRGNSMGPRAPVSPRQKTSSRMHAPPNPPPAKPPLLSQKNGRVTAMNV